MSEFEEKLLARRREFSILRVDRADLSKNVLRGFTGFDIFLEQHPEFSERITFTAQLMPSRTDVPEYAEYLERIEALVAVVNHRHGTPDWMPIDLKLRDDLEEAMASYKHYDVMMVNAMFDGMNLVAKEGPLVNERDGVSILGENTGAHEELGEFALSVNPFDVQELADAIYAALTMSGEERARRAAGLKEIVTSRDPGDWIDEQVADIRKKARGMAPTRHLSSRRTRRELRGGGVLRGRTVGARGARGGVAARAARPRRGRARRSRAARRRRGRRGARAARPPRRGSPAAPRRRGSRRRPPAPAAASRPARRRPAASRPPSLRASPRRALGRPAAPARPAGSPRRSAAAAAPAAQPRPGHRDGQRRPRRPPPGRRCPTGPSHAPA